ncbi:MAG: hypothetical protein JRG86_12315 [Deltaproteobacteria bacterium]|nr:hypothetical protein [Deltaproteobacteria bacterium]MBW2497559.1 hypothetical protein [Deltaproteobacteria bacterium]
MRYLLALGIAIVALVVILWIGSQIAISVSQGTGIEEEFLRGDTENLCGYEVDSRHSLAGYDFDQWKEGRCEDLSSLDHCVLGCLSTAGTIEAARECYPRCLGR